LATQQNQAPAGIALFEPGVERRITLIVDGGSDQQLVPGTNIGLSEFQRYQLRGRQLQARAMASAIVGLAGAVAWPFKKLASAYRRARMRATASTQLRAMDDHLLRDIGLRREDIPTAVAGLMSRQTPARAATVVRQPDCRQPACNQPHVRAAA
jgi:uncharacterized protein YjiS (DUF1127 family)